MKKIYRNDLILLAIILFLCALIPIGRLAYKEDNDKTAVISHDGHAVSKISLGDEGYFEVGGVSIAVKNGKARVTSSTCPDSLCMGMGEAENVGDSIICVPNKVSIKIVGNEKTEDMVIAG